MAKTLTVEEARRLGARSETGERVRPPAPAPTPTPPKPGPDPLAAAAEALRTVAAALQSGAVRQEQVLALVLEQARRPLAVSLPAPAAAPGWGHIEVEVSGRDAAGRIARIRMTRVD